MTTNNIQHVVNKAYEEFLAHICPSFDEEQIKGKLKIPISDLFEKQRTTDKTKSSLGEDFPQALRLFFQMFITKNGDLDAKRLKYGIEPYEKNFLRHLGKDRLAFLKLLISIHDALDEKRRGLIFGDAS